MAGSGLWQVASAAPPTQYLFKAAESLIFTLSWGWSYDWSWGYGYGWGWVQGWSYGRSYGQGYGWGWVLELDFKVGFQG